jgi:hypothetical protein
LSQEFGLLVSLVQQKWNVPDESEHSAKKLFVRKA